MPTADSRVTVHMAASLDGFIARPDGRVDWMETPDHFEGGATMDPDEVRAFLATIDCYVMGSHTYETALAFAQSGAGWAYGDTPVVVLTTRDLPRVRDTVTLHRGDVGALLHDLRARYHTIWVVGGGAVCGACLRLGLADEVRWSILPIVLGRGVPFFAGLDIDVPLHLLETKAYASGMVALRYEVRREVAAPDAESAGTSHA